MFFAFDYSLLLKLKKFLIFLKKTLKSTYYQSEKYLITQFRVDRFALSQSTFLFVMESLPFTSYKIITPLFAPDFQK